MAFDSTKPAYQGPLNSQPIRDNFNALKTQLDVEHNADGTHKNVLQATGGTSSGDLSIRKTYPALRLTGLESGSKDLRIYESAGHFYIQKNTGTEAAPNWVSILKVNADSNLIEVAQINQNNLASTTVIPDTKLGTISTAGKVSLSALPGTLAKTDSANTFTSTSTFQNSTLQVKLDNPSGTTYYGTVYINSSGTLYLQIKRKSDNATIKEVALGTDGKLSVQSVSASSQLISTVASGTAPLVVNSTTQVNNLNASYVRGYYPSAEDTPGTLVLRDSNGYTLNHALQAGTAYVVHKSPPMLEESIDLGGDSYGTRYTNVTALVGSTTPTKVAEYWVPHGGTVTVGFTALRSGSTTLAAYYAHARVYVNGVAAGPDHAWGASGPQTFSDNITLASPAGSIVQLYLWRGTASATVFAYNISITSQKPPSYFVSNLDATQVVGP